MLWPASLFHGMARRTSKKAATKEISVAAQAETVENEWSDGDGNDEEIPGRLDLLAEAIRVVRAAIKTERAPTRTSIGNLVQLLKLHKEMIQEEERPTHIQLVWNEVDQELYGND